MRRRQDMFDRKKRLEALEALGASPEAMWYCHTDVLHLRYNNVSLTVSPHHKSVKVNQGLT